MAIVGAKSAIGPKTGGMAPKGAVQQATKPAAPAKKTGFGASKPRAVREFLPGILGETVKYVLRVNKCIQVWANPKAVEDDRPQPTDEEVRTAKAAYKKKDAFSYEVEVIETTHPEVKPGMICSVTTTDRYPESYFADVKGFLCAVLGVEPEEIDLPDWQAAYQPDQPHAGKIIMATVHQQKNRTGEGSFTKVIPRALEQEEYDALIAEHPELEQ